MKKPIYWLILAGLLILLIVAGFRQVQKSKIPTPKSLRELQEEQGVPVEVETAILDTFRLSRSFLGTVQGGQQADVVAPLPEKIVSLPLEVGARVSKGQVVARFDARAPAAQHLQAKLAYEDAEREVNRLENLYQVGAVSEQMLQKAQFARDVTKQNYESSSELVALTSPLDGLVTEIFYRLGESPEVGKPVVRIANLQIIQVEFQINFEDHRLINEKTPAFLSLNGAGSTELPARISKIGLSADPHSRLFSVWVTMDNAQALLQPGLLVEVRLVVIEKPGVTLIPRDALLTRNDQLGVFVVTTEQRAVFTPVQIGGDNAAQVEVLHGITPEQRVVINGQNRLKGGELVKIIAS